MGQDFTRTFNGTLCMPHFMTVPVKVDLRVTPEESDRLSVTVIYEDPMGAPQPLFTNRFTTSVRQLADGRSARMFAKMSTVSPAPGRRVAIHAQTWYWAREIELSRDDVDDFLLALDEHLSNG